MGEREPEPRIQQATPKSEDEIYELLEPEVRDWFTDRFDGFTPPQRYAVAEIHERQNVLISSPTGTGKTLSAFLAGINELVAEAKQGQLEDRVYVLYVSPLKALNNDIERNLEGPLSGIREKLDEAGVDADEIRVGVRTGDTSQYERQKMTDTPPHILITTPETLGIVLNAPTFSEHLRRIGWVIVDEVHSLAENKRGTHLMLSLERLCGMIRRDAPEDQAPGDQEARRGVDRREPVRIGLSATIHPLERVAGFLVGRAADGVHRPCRVVDVTYAKEVEVEVLCPVEDVVSTPGDVVTDRLYETLHELIQDHETTLVFTNTRAGTERVVHHLSDRFPDAYEDAIGAHHGSMSKDTRLSVEDRLREGELDAVVTSTSLELGIDIGSVDLVVLLSSPRGVSRALQRIGRSGHRLGAKSKGALVALDRDDLVECTVIGSQARKGRLDELSFPSNPLDVLCQHLVGMALERVWEVDDVYATVRRAEPYQGLDRGDFEACLEYLSSEALNERKVYPKIWWDKEEGAMGRRGRKTRPIYYMNIGTIPDSTQLTVKSGDDAVGSIDEEFVESLSKGDVFVLGGSTWEYRGASPVKARVRPAAGKRPTVPRWVSEALPLSFEMAQRVAAFRRELADVIKAKGEDVAARYLEQEHGVPEHVAASLVEYHVRQLAYAGVPGRDDALVEEYQADDGRTRYIFHTPVGRNACEALARAFSHRVEQNKDIDVAWMVNDYGFVITLPPRRKLTSDEVRGLFLVDLADELYEAIDDAELLRRRFRYVAARALMILRNYMGTEISVGRQNATARQLLRHLQREHPDSPVLKETYREILQDVLDYENAHAYLFRFVSRQATVRFERGLPAPSPFAFNLVSATTPASMLREEDHDVIETFETLVEDALET